MAKSKKYKVGDTVWAESPWRPKKVVQAVVYSIEPTTRSYYVRFENGSIRQLLSTIISQDKVKALDLAIELAEFSSQDFTDGGMDDIVAEIKEDLRSLMAQKADLVNQAAGVQLMLF